MNVIFERKERYLNAEINDGGPNVIIIDTPLNQSYFSKTYLNPTKPNECTGYTIYNQASGGELYIAVSDLDLGNIEDNEGTVFDVDSFELFLRTFTSMTTT